MKKLVLAAATLLALTSASHAGGVTGKMWMDDCQLAMKDPKKDKTIKTVNDGYMWAMAHSSCHMYARGVADGLMMAGHGVEGNVPIACMEDDIDASQLRDVGMRYIRNNPESRHKSANLLLSLAFHAAWPCENEDQKTVSKKERKS